MTAAELKASILDLAVRGQLIPQNPKDKPADKPSDIDDPPYELPRNWVWKYGKEIGTMERGAGIKRNETIAEGCPCLRYGEIYTSYTHYLDNAKSFIPSDLFNACKHIKKNDLVFTLTGENEVDIAKTLAYLGDDEIAAGGDLAIWSNHKCHAPYLAYMMAAPSIIKQKAQSATGNFIVHTSTKKIGEVMMPLPPLPEQKRIVAKIEELLPLVEEYGAAQKELEALNSDFPAALRESILQDAVQGKLTAEWRRARVERFEKFETAQDLLDRIAAEKKRLLTAKKIKKEKPLPPITDDEKPFEIPDTWAWCRLGEICSKVGAGATPKGGSNVYVSRGVKLLREQNVHDDGLHLDNVVFITKEANDAKPGSQVRARDILVNITGASIGRNALVPDDFDVANVNQHVLIVRLVDLFLRHYIHESLRSSAVLNQMFDKQTGDKPGLSAEKVKAFLIPLPPLAEQKAIVERVDELLKIVDAMKAQ